MEVADTLGFLLGHWELSRSYTDHRAGTTGTFRGQAALAVTPDAGGRPEPAPSLLRARYEEDGQLSLGGYQGPASRSLDCVRQPDGSLLLYRASGELFIPLDLASGTWTASHPCQPDTYEVSFTVRSHDVVEESWRVRGPAKDYDAVTTLRRR